MSVLFVDTESQKSSSFCHNHFTIIWRHYEIKTHEFFHGKFTGFSEVFQRILMAKFHEVFMEKIPRKKHENLV